MTVGDRTGSARDLALAMLWKVPPRHLRVILECLEAGLLPFPWSAEDLDLLRGELPPATRQALLQLPTPSEIARARTVLEARGIHLMRRGDPSFPPELDAIPDPPPFLFRAGTPLAAPGAARVAVIGSRAASEAGREIAYGLARDLALNGVEVVSGMARGIDGEAHRGALDAGGRTLAVLGTGADVCYPPEHADLMRRILRRGGLITEFPPGTPGLRLHFPRRNRILTGLARALVVVEGGERSGARSSVDHALDQGREVLAVPRDIVHPGGALPNRLIQDGARPVLGVRDVLEAISAPGRAAGRGQAGGRAVEQAGAPAERAPGLGPLESRLLELLGRRRLDHDGCLRQLPDAPPGALQAALLRLEVMGWIIRHPGGRFARAAARRRSG